MHKLTCAIIGFGYMGEIRKKVISAHPQLSLSMICDSEIEIIPNFGEFEVSSNYDDVVEGHYDLVFISTPNYLIPKLTIQCLNRGKHVFCEKPPGKSLRDIELMRQAELANPSSKLMFGFNHRYHPAVLRAKSIVDSGRMGKVISLRGLYGKSGGLNFGQSWRNNYQLSGGGILLDQGIHMLDLFNFFLGHFNEVKAFVSNSHWNLDVEDNAMVILKNDENQLALLHSSATSWKHQFQLNINLEKGYLRLDGLLSKSGSYGRETLIIGRRQFEDEADAVGNPIEETVYFDRDLSWEIEINYFVDCIIQNTPVLQSNSKDAWSAMDIVERCYENSSFPLYSQEIF